MNYYNDNDPGACAWLRELIANHLIPDGIVDWRSICDVRPEDLAGFTQCHFFAGIGGWSYALQLAGWGADRPVWTASLPCQPFSTAGEQKGASDDRHLWPYFYRLARQCRPVCIFGEQVARAIGFDWLDGISADLEMQGYAVGQAVLGAHSAGAPHIRQRLYWVAHTDMSGSQGQPGVRECSDQWATGADSVAGGMDNACGTRGEQREHTTTPKPGGDGANDGIPGATGHWGKFDLVHCTDGKARRIESGTFPLAHGVPGRVGLLRGYGNAIVPQVAAQFIQAAEGTLAGE